MAWTGRDRSIRVLDLDSNDLLAIPAHDAQIWSIAWDGEGERLVSASADGTAAVWSSAGESVERVRAPAWIRGASFVGERLALVGEDGVLRVLSHDGRPAERPAKIEIPEPPRECVHWDPKVIESGVARCGECDSIESLRLCVTCGHVGCCESQRAHGTKHWERTGHPNTIPTPRGPFAWRWCYADDAYVKRVAGPRRRERVA